MHVAEGPGQSAIVVHGPNSVPASWPVSVATSWTSFTSERTASLLASLEPSGVDGPEQANMAAAKRKRRALRDMARVCGRFVRRSMGPGRPESSLESGEELRRPPVEIAEQSHRRGHD